MCSTYMNLGCGRKPEHLQRTQTINGEWLESGLKAYRNLLLKNIVGQASMGFGGSKEQLISLGKGKQKPSLAVNLEVTVTNWQAS